MWAAANPRYFVPWSVHLVNADDPAERYTYTLELRGQKVALVNGSPCLGDAIAWMPYAEEFRRHFECEVSYFTPLRQLFEQEYPGIRFVESRDALPEPGGFIGYEVQLELDPERGRQQHPRDFRTIPLQQLATDILGLPYRELVPRIREREGAPRRQGRYVCIATQSTAQAKYWTRAGWEQLVEHLKRQGYDVLCIDKERVFGIEGWWNEIPANCIDKTGDIDIEDRIADLRHCEFFVGLSSGLAWVAWALGRPVVLISGFTDPRNEFATPYRVINHNVCNSCWNDPAHTFERSDWLWCPRLTGTPRMFECGRGISFEMVREAVDACIRRAGGARPASG
jgi:autotransporter strand-loop-strand O-heptosyltransferase